MASTNEIRQTFLDYFAANGHQVVASSPLVPHNDPSLMFTNAGMVQFKNVFTGAEHRDYARAATAQKCVRAGGKHNDLDNVGYTARHHTFFEMLGNFSFGDYFKELAIELAWNLVTREYGLDAKRLLVTVYHEDDEAFSLWRRIAGLPEERIIRIATSDNFWAMGDTGPCGPCSEIFYDHGPEVAGGPPGSADEDGDRFIEIWNLVFMQFEQLTPAERVALPKPSIDTGMGLERVAAVLQGKHDNYDCDLMRALLEASAELTGTEPDGLYRHAHKVVADHLRAASFLVADGVMPSNEGRGYVLRRIIRRAVRHVHQMGHEELLLYQLVPVLERQMGQQYPELGRAEPLIVETLKLEESRFRTTLARGLHLLGEAVEKLGASEALPGEVAFRLYDTYGFPLDLTQDVLRAQGRGVEVAGFEAAMQRQREAARASWAGSGEAATARIWFELRERVGATEFLGYSAARAEAVLQAIVVEGGASEALEAGREARLVVNQTPFYGESGGQMGDSGWIVSAGGARFRVANTEKQAGDLVLHVGSLEAGRLAVGDAVELAIDAERRQALRLNHSATHLLHAALRQTLGAHVTQKGSLVAPDRLRFDVSHPKPVTAEELARVEAEVNRQIRLNAPVSTRLMQPEQAVAAGALALFGEKYGEEVRVVSMGGADDAADIGPSAFSTELCGGTHVARTGDIGAFKIVSEGPVAAGVRRLEAVTGAGALAYVGEQQARLKEIAALLRTTPGEAPARVQALIDERRRLERELQQARQALASGGAAAAEVRAVNGVAFRAQRLDGVPAKELRAMIDRAKRELGSGVVALIAVNEGKAALSVGVTDDLTDRFNAVELVQAGARALGGSGGGGRPDLAQAGGPDGAGADRAIAAIEQALAVETAA
jgi:alanyl-tRNA synthetase